MPTTLKASVVAFLSCWFMYAAGQVNVKAECHNEYRWTFNSLGQSPCVVAAALAVCNGHRTFDLPALPSGFQVVYYGPNSREQNDCVCNSVFYSLLSACAYCQEHAWIPWSLYHLNCTVTTSTMGMYYPDIPAEVKVPAWAYLRIENDIFDPERAKNEKGSESTRVPGASGTTSGFSLSLPTPTK